MNKHERARLDVIERRITDLGQRAENNHKHWSNQYDDLSALSDEVSLVREDVRKLAKAGEDQFKLVTHLHEGLDIMAEATFLTRMVELKAKAYDLATTAVQYTGNDPLLEAKAVFEWFMEDESEPENEASVEADSEGRCHELYHNGIGAPLMCTLEQGHEGGHSSAYGSEAKVSREESAENLEEAARAYGIDLEDKL